MNSKTIFQKLGALIMLLILLPASAAAFSYEDLQYGFIVEQDTTVAVLGTAKYYDYPSNIIIPDKIIYGGKTYRVKEIAKGAFCEKEKLRSVTIGNSVTTIEEWAFRGCYALTSVAIPNSVTTIGESAFSGCYALTSVTIPNSVTTIGEWAFSGCYALTSLSIGNSVITIGNDAFYGCEALTSVTIPGSVITIGDSAFSQCSNLESIDVDSRNENYSSNEGILYNRDRTTLIFCPAKKTNVNIPNSVTTIGYCAFSGCEALTSVEIPNSVTTIGYCAFSGCEALTSVEIPNSVTTIEDGTFSNCYALTSVTIPNSVTTIGHDVFSCCEALTSVTIPNSVTTIGYCAFSYCGALTSVTIPDSVTIIGFDAFSDCDALTSIYNMKRKPVECDPNFPYKARRNATLYVPTGTLKAYQMVDPWRNFWNIKETDFSGIEDITINKDSQYTVFDLQGIQVLKTDNSERTNALPNGIYIVNGKKMVVK